MLLKFVVYLNLYVTHEGLQVGDIWRGLSPLLLNIGVWGEGEAAR
jgi:hypothetical protein